MSNELNSIINLKIGGSDSTESSDMSDDLGDITVNPIENTDLDVYINGTIVARAQMQDVPKQNYENVNICKNGGFNGNIADLQYFDKAISIFQINNIVAWGRNTNAANENASGDATGFPYYLSNLWYSSNY